MKRIMTLFCLMFMLGAIAQPAQASILNLDPIVDFLKNCAKKTYSGVGTSIAGKRSGQIMSPIHTLHNGKKEDDPKRLNYFTTGIGYTHFSPSDNRFNLAISINMLALSDKIWRWAVRQKYLDGVKLPVEAWAGTYVEFPDSQPWVGKERIGFNFMVRWGQSKKKAK